MCVTRAPARYEIAPLCKAAASALLESVCEKNARTVAEDRLRIPLGCPGMVVEIDVPAL